MPTLNYFIYGEKRELVPVYVRLSAGKKVDLIVKSGLLISPDRWSQKTQTIKQRIRDKEDEKFLKKYSALQKYLNDLIIDFSGEYSKEWLHGAIDKFHNKKASDAKTLNEYIDKYLKDAETGERKNKDLLNLSFGTVKGWKSFRRVLNEYQGIYTEKRLEWLKKNNKKPRKYKLIDFDDITIDFYHSFVNYLSDEGYKRGTIGRFIKTLKMFMKKSLEDKLHNNRQFEYSAFKGFASKSFSTYLTRSELEKIYNIDLSLHPELDIARDAFMVLNETALRISDYSKVDLSVRKTEDGAKLLYITQSKTGGEVVIPLSTRLEAILKKYNGNLPKLPDQYINRRIKTVAFRCGINEELRWEDEKSGKTFEKKAQKWELITCHTARRSAATNMYLAGIPTISIMAITGHKTEAQFLKYIKVTPEQNALKLAEHPYFRNGNLKVV